MKQPLVSVVMPVYNAEAYLREAIDSILSQSLADLELIVVDDGSTDGSPDIIQSYRDPRMRPLRLNHMGVGRARAVGMRASKAALVASMDGDDVSLPSRLEKQVAFLDYAREYVMVATRTRSIDSRGASLGEPAVPLADNVIRFLLPVMNTFANGSVMMRREALDRAGGYPALNRNEDWALWLALRREGRLATLDEVLYLWRITPSSLSADRDAEVPISVAISREAAQQAVAADQVGSLSEILSHVVSTQGQVRPMVAMAYRAYAYEFLIAGRRARALCSILAAALVAPRRTPRSAKRMALMLGALVSPRVIRRLSPREYS